MNEKKHPLITEARKYIKKQRKWLTNIDENNLKIKMKKMKMNNNNKKNFLNEEWKQIMRERQRQRQEKYCLRWPAKDLMNKIPSSTKIRKG